MKFQNIIFLFFSFILFASCENPFSPKLAGNIIEETVLGDQTTVDGVFKNFRYAYIFKDTLVYGNLLTDNFTFIYNKEFINSVTKNPPKYF